MKKNTQDILPGDNNNLIIIPSSPQPEPKEEKYTDLNSDIKISWKKKAIDFSLPPEKKEKTPRFRRRFWAKKFFALFAFFVLGTVSVAGVNVMAKKREMEKLTSELQIEFESGISALSSQNFSEASESFARSQQVIAEMQVTLDPLLRNNFTLENDLGSTAKDLLEVASDVAESAEKLAKIAPDLKDVPESLLNGDGEKAIGLMQFAENEIKSAEKSLQKAEGRITQISALPLPNDWNARVNELKNRLPEAKKAIKMAKDLFPASYELFGENYPHTTAIFFQNSGEIRATGGFPGSMALLTANNGKLDFQFRDIYFFDWKNGTQIPPPRGFDRIAKRLNIQDSNSFFDFPTSAAQMRDMLENSGGPTADTIVVVSDDLFSELLKYTGPLEIPGTNEVLSAEDTAFFLSFFVEGKHFGRHSPKEAIAEVLPELQEKAKYIPPEKIFEMLKTAIRKKWILAHSVDSEIQRSFESLGISGEVKKPETRDYLAVVSANVGGNKSDHFLREYLQIESVLTIHGDVTNTLTINRKHEWSNQQEKKFQNLVEQYPTEYVPSPLLKNILGAGENHSYTEVYVPIGAKIMSAQGIPLEKINTFQEAGKTVFAFRFPKVPAGEMRLVSLQYTLPRQSGFQTDFDLYYQFQPGRDSVLFSREIFAESGVKITEGEKTALKLESDVIFRAKLEK